MSQYNVSVYNGTSKDLHFTVHQCGRTEYIDSVFIGTGQTVYIKKSTEDCLDIVLDNGKKFRLPTIVKYIVFRTVTVGTVAYFY